MLSVLGIDEALSLLLGRVQPIGRREILPVSRCVGCILADEIQAMADVPGFVRSSVDGLAVRAVDTFGASDSLPAMLRLVGAVQMGRPAPLTIGPGQCAAVPTGGAIPEGADAMVMIEYVEQPGGDLCLVNRPSAPGRSRMRDGL